MTPQKVSASHPGLVQTTLPHLLRVGQLHERVPDPHQLVPNGVGLKRFGVVLELQREPVQLGLPGLDGSPDLGQVLQRVARASGSLDALKDGCGGGQSDLAAVSAHRDRRAEPDRDVVRATLRSFRVVFIEIGSDS